MNIAVIGSGFGGLAAALLLAHEGHEVTIFEKEAQAGGKAQQLELGDYRFDTGPSLLTMPFVFEELFSKVGKNFSDYVPYKKLNTLCKYWFADGTQLSTYNEKEKLFAELLEKTATTRKELEEWFSYTKKIYDTSKDTFLLQPFLDFRSMKLSALSTLFQLHHLDTNRTMRRAIEQHFADPCLQQLFSRYATYTGSNPFICPATLNIVSQVEYQFGGYYPEKGIYSLVEGMVKACTEEGVQFIYQAPVQKLCVENKAVCGLQVQGKKIPFDKVISNVDVSHLYTDLIEREKERKKYTSLEPSSSALVFYWAVEKSFPELDAHNIFFSADYEKEFDQLFTEKTCGSDPTIYISISSKYAPSDAPNNCENWFVMINAPYDDGQDWEKMVREQRKLIKTKLEKHLGPIPITNEAILTPVDIAQKTNANKGAIYGTSSNNKLAAFLRHKNKAPLKNLYCCGGTTHPGGGMTLSTLSGMFAARLAQR